MACLKPWTYLTVRLASLSKDIRIPYLHFRKSGLELLLCPNILDLLCLLVLATDDQQNLPVHKLLSNVHKILDISGFYGKLLVVQTAILIGLIDIRKKIFIILQELCECAAAHSLFKII